MDKRIKLGLIFTYTEDHIAISYYILNIVRGLNQLSDEEKPEITIFCNTAEDFDRIKKTGYPYLKSQSIIENTMLTTKVINRVSKMILKKGIVGKKYPKETVDVIFPGSFLSSFRSIPHKLYWAGDYQDLYYPEFFSKIVLQKRQQLRKKLAISNAHIVFSSYDSQQQFEDHFPKNNAIKHVYQFTVTHPEYDSLNIEELRAKYGINQRYFITPNQFWAHKNHKIIIEAAKLLKEAGKKFQIIFTGRERDGRKLNYAENLKKEVVKLGLEEEIKFLGFIDRRDLLKLIKCSIAVVQPSFFEGWNTTVEDAKAINKLVIASNLEVHIEQLEDAGIYFDPKDSTALFELLAKELDDPTEFTTDFEYQNRIKLSGQKFASILNQVCQDKKVHA